VSDLEKRGARGQIFPAYLCRYTLIPFDLERYGGGESCFYIPMERAPASPNFFGPRAHGISNSNQILHGDQMR